MKVVDTQATEWEAESRCAYAAESVKGGMPFGRLVSEEPGVPWGCGCQG